MDGLDDFSYDPGAIQDIDHLFFRKVEIPDPDPPDDDCDTPTVIEGK